MGGEFDRIWAEIGQEVGPHRTGPDVYPESAKASPRVHRVCGDCDRTRFDVPQRRLGMGQVGTMSTRRGSMSTTSVREFVACGSPSWGGGATITPERFLTNVALDWIDGSGAAPESTNSNLLGEHDSCYPARVEFVPSRAARTCIPALHTSRHGSHSCLSKSQERHVRLKHDDALGADLN